MSDNGEISGEKQRPNANYRLSREKAEEEGIVFHYSREQRLAKAPQAVRDLYEQKPNRRQFGLLGPLVGSKPRMMMFGSIVVLCVIILIISGLGLASDSHVLDGNQITVQAVRYEGTTIVVLKKSPQTSSFLRTPSNAPYAGAVDIAVQPSQKNAEASSEPLEDVFYHRIFFTLEPTEYYRFAVPFDADELAFVLRTEKKILQLMLKPE